MSETPSKPLFQAGPSTFEEAWQRFAEASKTLGPTSGAREDWHKGRPRYAVWILRIQEPEILGRMARSREVLAPWIREMPARDAHITVAVAGFPAADAVHNDDVAEADLARAIAGLRAEPLPAPRLVVGPMNAFLSCSYLEIHDPHGDLAAVRARLAGYFREVRFTPYLPHITTGLFNADPTRGIVEAIRPHRGEESMGLIPRSLELVTFDSHSEGAQLLTHSAVNFQEFPESGS